MIALRAALGLAHLLVPLVAGFHGRSPWLLVALAPVFAIGHALGKSRVWAPLLRAGPSAKLLTLALTNVVGQLVALVVFYLFGLGVGALLGEPLPLRPFTSSDALTAALFALLSIGGGVVVMRAERG